MNQIVENRPTETILETNFGNEAQIEYVAYGLLCRSPSNVRKKAPTGIEELAITIEAKGLMQNLVAHAIKGSRAKQPKLGVCAGQRRLAALDLLFAQGKITKNHPVPVKVVSEAEAVAASLLENQHEPMHPADQCEAFRMLAEEGKSIEYIAALIWTLCTVSPDKHQCVIYREHCGEQALPERSEDSACSPASHFCHLSG